MTVTDYSKISPDILADIATAAQDAANGTRNLREARAACEEMDRIREEIRKKHGVLDIGVPAIRELRDS
ncbi:MAG: hypothetical protein HYX68_29280 [Planctomycetes bacterium]|nr:hypothetical protein [Planctomycetota bacterium]